MVENRGTAPYEAEDRPESQRPRVLYRLFEARLEPVQPSKNDGRCRLVDAKRPANLATPGPNQQRPRNRSVERRLIKGVAIEVDRDGSAIGRGPRLIPFFAAAPKSSLVR